MPTVQDELQDRLNVVSYARAICRAAKTIVQKAEEGYDGIINPSRGANPIARGIFSTIGYMAQWDETARSLAERMYSGVTGNSNHTFPIVPVPLTADIRMDYRDLRYLGLTVEQVIDRMRYYGADVIKTFSYDPEKRMKDRSFRLLTWLFSALERRHGIRRFYEELPPVKKPIFIDTAISGRASSTILHGLAENRFHVYPIIFADGFVEGRLEGGRLRKNYRKYLADREHLGDLGLVKMRRIMTEDQGAALLGVYAAFYPQILMAALDMGLPNASAVTWYDVSQDGHRLSDLPYRETFQSFMNLMTRVTQMVCSTQHELGDEFDQLDDKEVLEFLPQDQLSVSMGDVLETIRRHNVPRREEPNTIQENFQLPIESAFETSSHVIHIQLSQRYLEEKVKELRSILRT